MVTKIKRELSLAGVVGALLMLSLLGCHTHDQESFYSNMEEAQRDGAIVRGWIPEFLPRRSRNIHEVHDLSPSTSWCAFEFDPHDRGSFESSLKGVPSDTSSFGPVQNPHVTWWPEFMRGTLDVQAIQRGGFRMYTVSRPVSQAETEILLFVIDWQRGQGFFTDAWSKEVQ